MEDFGWKALEVLLPVVATALTILIGFAVRWLSARVGNERLQTLFAFVAEAIETSVREIEQTMVEGLKAARLDGTLSDDEKTAVLKATIESAKRSLGPKGLALLEAAAGVGEAELEAWLSSRIEAAVQKLRAS